MLTPTSSRANDGHANTPHVLDTDAKLALHDCMLNSVLSPCMECSCMSSVYSPGQSCIHRTFCVEPHETRWLDHVYANARIHDPRFAEPPITPIALLGQGYHCTVRRCPRHSCGSRDSARSIMSFALHDLSQQTSVTADASPSVLLRPGRRYVGLSCSHVIDALFDR